MFKACVLKARPISGVGLRESAAAINKAVVKDRQDPEHVLGPALVGLEPRDAALLKAMVYGMLRWHHRLDWQCRSLLGGHKAVRDSMVAALVRCGLFQIQFLRVPDHAAVASTVEAARRVGKTSRVGLINAVLRRYLRERAAFEPSPDNPVAFFSHPRWFLDVLQSDWPERWRDVLTANNEPPPMWLRVNARQTTAAEYQQALLDSGLEARQVPDAGPDALLLEQPVAVDQLPGFATGRVSVQDAAAQLACAVLDLAPGMRVLDACAAPGGKSAHMLERHQNLQLVALDRSPARLARMQAGLERLGLNAELLSADAAATATWWDQRPFDRILLDAPCSATGVIRRHPDIKLLRRPDDVQRARAEQARLLDQLWPLLATGGRLVYATCSVLRAENQVMVAEFLDRTADATLPGRGQFSTKQILPGEANMDGFYYACLLKGR
jgi:16S rRNA (cytosine967-C5)-methyltransferase